MDLTNEQKEQLKTWLTEGMSLSDIHKQVTGDWDLSMTYMELRFLIDDLELEFPKEEEPLPEEAATEDSEKPVEEGDLELVGGVTVDVDKVMRPGALVSGSATFSDGVTATWQLDQMGRIGLSPSQEGYKPSQEDLAEFQKNIQSAMQKAGF